MNISNIQLTAEPSYAQIIVETVLQGLAEIQNGESIHKTAMDIFNEE